MACQSLFPNCTGANSNSSAALLLVVQAAVRPRNIAAASSALGGAERALWDAGADDDFRVRGAGRAMSLWHRERSEPMPPEQRLEQMLYGLAAVIGDSDESDRFWSGKVRACADHLSAGQVWGGAGSFRRLFGGSRNTITGQAFSHY
jgi:hypothetical protein